MAVEDTLVNGWTAEDKRSLLDLVTGGKYSEAKDLPPLTEVAPKLWDKVKEAGVRQRADLSKEIYPGYGVTGSDLMGMVIGSSGGVIRTASTASKLFRGWRYNLEQFMKSASKKEGKRAKAILRDAIGVLDEDDIKITKHGLHIINKEYGLTGKVLVPEIKGAAGGKMRQASKKREQSLSRKKTARMTKQRETAKKVKKESRTGGEPKHQRGAKLVRKY